MITHMHDRANTFVFGHTHAHSHTHVHMHGHTWPSSPAWVQHPLSAPRRETLRDNAARRRLSPMLRAVSQFPLLAQPSTPTAPGPVGPGAARSEWGKLEPCQSQGLAQPPLPRTTRQQSPADLAAKCHSSPCPVAKPAITRLAAAMGRSIIPLSFLSLSKQHHGKIQPQSERAHPGGWGRPQHLPCSMIWDMPAWHNCPEHPQAHPSTPAGQAVSPPDPGCATTSTCQHRGSPMPDHCHGKHCTPRCVPHLQLSPGRAL